MSPVAFPVIDGGACIAVVLPQQYMVAMAIVTKSVLFTVILGVLLVCYGESFVVVFFSNL